MEAREALEKWLGGTVDGLQGDHVLLAPPYIASPDQLQQIATLLAQAVEAVVPAQAH